MLIRLITIITIILADANSAQAINLSDLVPTKAAINGSVLKTGNILQPTNRAGDEYSMVIGGNGITSTDILLHKNGGAIFNEQSRDVDFRVEGDSNTNLLYLDAGNDRVGILRNDPATALDLSGNGLATVINGTNTNFALITASTINAANGNFANIIATTLNGVYIANGESLIEINGDDLTAGIVAQNYGGTGSSNTGTFTYGSNNLTFTTTGGTTVTLPISGTLDTLTATKTLRNKTLETANFNGSVSQSNGNLLIHDTNAANTQIIIGSSDITLASNADIIFNEQSRNVNFRVEGDSNANLLYLDAANDRAGVLKANPSTALDIAGTSSSSTINGTSLNTTTLISTTANGTNANFTTVVGSSINGASLIGNGSALTAINGSNFSAGLLATAQGGLGASNTGSLTYGSNNITFTTGGVTSVNLPTTGTLTTLTGTENLSNKTIETAYLNGAVNLVIGTFILSGQAGSIINGDLTLNSGDLTINGTLTLADGTEANGLLLTSDANGVTSWAKHVVNGVTSFYDGDNVTFGMDINGLTTETSLDTINDYIPYFDASAGAVRKLAFTNIAVNSAEVSAIAEGFVGIVDAQKLARENQIAKSIQVAFTDGNSSNTPGGSNSNSFSLTSAADRNVIFKKEPSDDDFVYLTTLDLGENYRGDLPAGTFFSSTKGIAGYSFCNRDNDNQCGPMPFGLNSFAGTQFFFFAFRDSDAGSPAVGTNNTGIVYVATGSVPATVSMYSGNGNQLIDGPDSIEAFSSTIFFTNDNAEFQIVSDQPVFAAVDSEGGSKDHRLIPPLTTDLIVWTNSDRVSALNNGTTANYFRRDMTSGSLSIDPGNPQQLPGSNTDYEPNGCFIVRADGPIAAFAGADSLGSEATYGVPLTALAQLFPITGEIDTNTDYGRSSIVIASPYEGTATIYQENGSLLDTFTFTRGTSPAVTAADQQYPAAGRWSPGNDLINGSTLGPGGWVETDVPSICIMNFSNNNNFDFEGDEIVIPGVTPDELRAEIRKDANGMLRKRTIDASGNVTWDLI